MRRLSSKGKNSPVTPKHQAESSDNQSSSRSTRNSKPVAFHEDSSDDEPLAKIATPKSSKTREANANGARSKKEADTASSDDEENYEVEAIIASRYMHGKHQYKIRWKGFGADDDTWENEDNLDCPDLIAQFQQSSANQEKKATKRNSVSEGKEAVSSSKKKKKEKQVSKKTSNDEKDKPIKEDDDDDDDDGKEWEVSKIIHSAELDGVRHFLVRWKGYNSKHDTWEPEENLCCPDLIQKFLEKEKMKGETDREFREVRRQTQKYNPDLAKRQSHRSSSKKRVFYYDLE